MSLKDDLINDAKNTYTAQWTRRNGLVVPQDADIKLGNDAVDLKATILYADLSDSTKMVDKYKDWFAAENYKAFLNCASKIIRTEGGEIRSFDGDRVMGIFIGDTKNTSAVRCALKINWAIKNIINKKIKEKYTSTDYQMQHVVGVDTSDVMVIRGGIRGSNDLLWVGKAPNYAAKLTSMDHNWPTWITHRVYDNMKDEVKFSSGKNMWEARSWTPMENLTIYRSSYWWSL